MGPGMMGASGRNGQPAQTQVNQVRAKALVGYIRSRNLPCMQCHAVSGGGYGPPFGLVASDYRNRADAESTLAARIAQGVGRMPGGLASEAQATHLATLILHLGDADGIKR